MIILSGVLVVLAIALLVTGIVTGNTGHEIAGLDGLKLIYVSIGVSIISALCLAIGVFLRRKELFGSAESEASTKGSASRSTKAARTAKTKARVGAGDDAPVTVTPAAATEVPAETSVFVVPGRKRYHLETCRQLAGRDKEELTFVEAREEGFTACTACLPDTALAARAALTEPGESAPTESLDTVADTKDSADTADLTPADDDPSLVTRIDLPVTKLHTDELDESESGDKDLDTRDVEPAEESPAAAGVTEDPEPDAFTETEPAADTARFDEVSESETASTPPTERPLARSRSLFEPLDHEDTATTDDTDTDDAATPDTEDATTNDTTADEDPADGPAPSTADADADAADVDVADADEDITSDGHVDAEPEHESPAESTEASETSVADQEATDEPDSGTAESTGTTTATDETSSADEPDDEPDGEPADTESAEHPDLPFVRILSGTKRYHRPDCALIEDIAEDADDLETVSPAEAKERGCTPCLVCQPDKDPEDRY